MKDAIVIHLAEKKPTHGFELFHSPIETMALPRVQNPLVESRFE
ncbi:hypothetical protein [Peribacillus sp.]